MQAVLCVCGQLAVEKGVSDCVSQLACVRLCQRRNMPGFCVRIVSGPDPKNGSSTTDEHRWTRIRGWRESRDEVFSANPCSSVSIRGSEFLRVRDREAAS